MVLCALRGVRRCAACSGVCVCVFAVCGWEGLLRSLSVTQFVQIMLFLYIYFT